LIDEYNGRAALRQRLALILCFVTVSLYCRAMREVVIVAVAAFLIGIMVAALLVHFLAW